MRVHYVPRFLLRRFKGNRSLFEYDKVRGTYLPRTVENAAQIEDFWPAGIEFGVMCKMDDHASKILRRRVWGPRRVELTHDERITVASWLSLLMCRVPKYQQRLAASHMTLTKTPQVMHSLLDQIGYAAAAKFLKDNPEELSRRTGKYGTYDLAVASQVIRWRAIWTLNNIARTDVTPAFVFERGLTHHATKLATDSFMAMKWRWIECDEADFVIGDNPVVVYGRDEQQMDYGHGLADAEVVVPLSSRLALEMTHDGTDTPEISKISEARVVELNWRQINSAIRYVFGPTNRSLRPGDEMAEYGF